MDREANCQYICQKKLFCGDCIRNPGGVRMAVFRASDSMNNNDYVGAVRNRLTADLTQTAALRGQTR